MAGGRAHQPSPLVAGIGKGRFLGKGRGALLERHDGSSWVTIGRFGTVREADAALDEAIGAGASIDELRVTEVSPSPAARVGLVVGIAVIAALIAWVLYIVALGPA